MYNFINYIMYIYIVLTTGHCPVATLLQQSHCASNGIVKPPLMEVHVLPVPIPCLLYVLPIAYAS